MSNKIFVIGAGISGLSAGIYAARSGFDVTIYEQHMTFGGLSTSWSRKGYYFEGGMHWLTGSSPKMPLYQIWKETGALKENNPIENRDPYYVYINGGKKLCMYRDLDKLCNQLRDFAPEDKKMIAKFYKDVKALINVHLVVNDIMGLKAKNPRHPKLGELLKMVPAGLKYSKLVNMSYEEYVNQFKNEDIRHLLMGSIGYRYNAMSFIYTIASFASGDCGYPEGGSVTMGQNMLDTFKSLGGKIEFKKKIENIELNVKGKVTGVKINGETIPCDGVIVTQDMRNAIDTLFDTMVDNHVANKMRKDVVSEQNVFICAGVKADLSHLPKAIVFPLKKPFEIAGVNFNEFRIYNYASFKGRAPEGGTALTSLFLGPSYYYWKQAKEDGTYKQKKEELANRFIELLEEYIPETKGKVEVTDVATPCTYERYCSSFEGSWMSVWEKGGKQTNYPQKLPGIEGVYFAGQRTMMPGGLPIAVYSGRIAVQLLCRDTKRLFV
ncbi:NAD(P)/FAD-dependent oxidoreductase [Treponema sp. C6A8]|uniref:phytoene desaturase family protein n=1 Tax=Treponema sp. C6A8 TaxID=1410609 RepID=UPI0004822592|nr:NAD(P)/FAD-dependent oxidoreductase [Treponema sp. C6A8]